jgi:hypothetical protein
MRSIRISLLAVAVAAALSACGGDDQLDGPTEHITDPPSAPTCPSADPFCQYDPGKTIELVKCSPGAPGCV